MGVFVFLPSSTTLSTLYTNRRAIEDELIDTAKKAIGTEYTKMLNSITRIISTHGKTFGLTAKDLLTIVSVKHLSDTKVIDAGYTSAYIFTHMGYPLSKALLSDIESEIDKYLLIVYKILRTLCEDYAELTIEAETMYLDIYLMKSVEWPDYISSQLADLLPLNDPDLHLTDLEKTKDAIIVSVGKAMLNMSLQRILTTDRFLATTSALLRPLLNGATRNATTRATATSTLVAKQLFTDIGVEAYIYSAIMDSRTSEICAEMNGKIFSMADLMIGVTAPPLHPNCRSSIMPYIPIA